MEYKLKLLSNKANEANKMQDLLIIAREALKTFGDYKILKIVEESIASDIVHSIQSGVPIVKDKVECRKHQLISTMSMIVEM